MVSVDYCRKYSCVVYWQLVRWCLGIPGRIMHVPLIICTYIFITDWFHGFCVYVSGERPYRCEQCSATFAYFSSLAAHRKLHSNNKPFICDVCGASFFTAYNLRLHSRKHSGERPYQCHLCPESFSWHSGLKCHLKKHQPGTVVWNKVCVCTSLLQCCEVYLEEVPNLPSDQKGSLKEHDHNQEHGSQRSEV